ncbi:unnamed protein product, partial [Phaeothamnion confervicola]
MKRKQNELQVVFLEGTDGAGKSILVCMRICVSEDAYNCHWVLQELKKVLKLRAGASGGPTAVIMKERGTAIVPVMATALPNALHMHCTVHMLRDIDVYLKK